MHRQAMHRTTTDTLSPAVVGGGDCGVPLPRARRVLLLLAAVAAVVACALAARARAGAGPRVEESEDYEAENAALLWAAGPDATAGTLPDTGSA